MNLFGLRRAELSDGELVARVAKGDESAFGELLERHQAAVYHFAGQTLGDYQEAEDIAQETFLRLYRAAAGYRPEAALRTFLFKIARNLCIDHLRKKRPELMEVLPDQPAADNPQADLEQAQFMERLKQAMSELPENQRTAITLRHNQNMSYAQIAEVMATTTSAVESLLGRARRTLRERLA